MIGYFTSIFLNYEHLRAIPRKMHQTFANYLYNLHLQCTQRKKSFYFPLVSNNRATKKEIPFLFLELILKIAMTSYSLYKGSISPSSCFINKYIAV